MTKPKYVNATEVAEYFGVSRASIFNRVTAGDIPPGAYLRIGRAFRFDLEAVEKALRDVSTPTTPVQLELDLEPDEDPEENFDYGN